MGSGPPSAHQCVYTKHASLSSGGSTSRPVVLHDNIDLDIHALRRSNNDTHRFGMERLYNYYNKPPGYLESVSNSLHLGNNSGLAVMRPHTHTHKALDTNRLPAVGGHIFDEYEDVTGGVPGLVTNSRDVSVRSAGRMSSSLFYRFESPPQKSRQDRYGGLQPKRGHTTVDRKGSNHVVQTREVYYHESYGWVTDSKDGAGPTPLHIVVEDESSVSGLSGSRYACVCALCDYTCVKLR
jgi:hypothetical protein